MRESTISQSLKSNFSPGMKALPVISACTPVEIFIIFVLYNQSELTVHQVEKIFDAMHKITLKYTTVRKVCNDLVAAGKLKRDHRLNKNRQFTYYYSFNKFI